MISPKKRFSAMTLCLALLYGTLGFAGEQITTEKIIVTARGVESYVSQTPGGTALIESQEFFQSQDMSLTNTLRKVAGVEKSSDSAWGSAINIRGLGRNRVVFLIDGCRVNTASDVNAQFGFIDPNEIERIEVLKGPISALYGSGSMGGVVNVITKKGNFSTKTQTKSSVAASMGTNPQGFTTFANTALNTSNFWLYASGGKRDYDSYEDGDGQEIYNSQFDDYHINLKSGYKWNPLNITQLNIQYLKGQDIGIPGKGLALPQGPDITFPETDRTLVSLTHEFIPEKGALSKSEINLFFQEIDRNVTMEFPAKAPMKSVLPSALHTTYGVKWQNMFDFQSHGLVTGLDIWSWEIESTRVKNFKNGRTGIDTPMADARQINAGFFLEDNIDLSSLFTLNLGGRLDYIKTRSDELYNWIVPPSPAMTPVLKRNAESDNDLSWDAHAGLTVNLSAPWSMTLLGAASYRAPDLMDKYKYLAFSGGQTYGNPDLDPERSLFLEYGIHYKQSDFRISGAVYGNFLKDMITEKLQSPGIYQMENVNKARIFGGELEAQWYLSNLWTLYANIAWTKGENETENEDLAFIPPLNGLAGIGYNPEELGLWGDLNLEWADNQNNVASGETPTSGWATVNAKAGYRFLIGQTHHDFMLGIDNLFDQQYANHLSTSRGVVLTDPGMNLYLAWKMDF